MPDSSVVLIEMTRSFGKLLLPSIEIEKSEVNSITLSLHCLFELLQSTEV